MRCDCDCGWKVLSKHWICTPHFRKHLPPPFAGKGGRNSGTIINHFFNFLRTHQHATAHSSNGASACTNFCSRRRVPCNFIGWTSTLYAAACCAPRRKQRGCFQGAHSSLVGHKTGKTARRRLAGVALAARSSSLAYIGGWGWIETMYAYST